MQLALKGISWSWGGGPRGGEDPTLYSSYKKCLGANESLEFVGLIYESSERLNDHYYAN